MFEITDDTRIREALADHQLSARAQGAKRF